jgi:hypothetical protein
VTVGVRWWFKWVVGMLIIANRWTGWKPSEAQTEAWVRRAVYVRDAA